MKGIVFPAKWDNNGKVIQVVLDTIDQGQYYVEQEGAGRGLWSLLSCEVDVHGSVRKDENGNFVLIVKSYHLLEDSETDMAA